MVIAEKAPREALARLRNIRPINRRSHCPVANALLPTNSNRAAEAESIVQSAAREHIQPIARDFK